MCNRAVSLGPCRTSSISASQTRHAPLSVPYKVFDSREISLASSSRYKGVLLLVRCSRLGQVIVEVSLWLFPLYHRSIVGSPITVYLPCKMQISQRLLQIHRHRLDEESARMGIVDAFDIVDQWSMSSLHPVGWGDRYVTSVWLSSSFHVRAGSKLSPVHRPLD